METEREGNCFRTWWDRLDRAVASTTPSQTLERGGEYGVGERRERGREREKTERGRVADIGYGGIGWTGQGWAHTPTNP